jgi:hypothetical protein
VPRSLNDFSDGFQLTRIILALIVQSYNYQSKQQQGGGSSSSSSSGVLGGSSSSSSSSSSLDNTYPTIEEFDLIKKSKNSTQKVLPLALTLGIKYLGLPIFDINDIINSNNDIIKAIITFLFLIACPSRLNDDNDIITKEVTDFNELLDNINDINDDIKRTDTLIEMQNVWAAMTNTSTDINFNPYPTTTTTTTTNDDDEGLVLADTIDNLNINNETTDDNVVVVVSDNNDSIQVNQDNTNDNDTTNNITTTITTTTTKPPVVYSELCQVVDRFLSSESQQLPTISMKTGQIMYKLKQYKERVKKTIDNESNGNRLGRQVRHHVIKHFTTNLLHQSKYISEE